MCGPFAIPIALAVAGTAMNYFGQQAADKARYRSFMAERQRQQGLQEQQGERFQNSLDKTKELLDPGKRDQAEANRESFLRDAIKPSASGSSFLPGSSSAPAVVASAAEKAGADSDARSGNFAATLAALGGVDDQMLGVNTQIGRNAGSIGQLGGFSRGSLDASAAEMRAAANKGSTLRMLGGLAQQIGQAWLGSSMGGTVVGNTATGGGSSLGGGLGAI